MPVFELPFIIEVSTLLVTVVFFLAMLKHKTDQCIKEIGRVEKDFCEHSSKVSTEIAAHKEKIEKVNISQASIETDIAAIKTTLIRIEDKIDRNK